MQTALWAGAIPYVMGLPAHRGSWAPADDPHTPEDAARAGPWESPRRPGGWTAVVRRCRDGHRETWWAADLRLGGMAWDQEPRLVAVTTDPIRLPADSTWYLLTNLPHPAAPHAATAPFTPATLAEIARLYGLRTGVQQGDKQMKQELGWAGWQVRSDRAIRRHWALVGCAFSFCWWAWRRVPDASAVPTGTAAADQPVPVPSPGRGKRGRSPICAPTGRTSPGRWRCGGCRPGSSHGPCSGAGGAPGPRCRHPRRSRPCLTGSGVAIRSTASSGSNIRSAVRPPCAQRGRKATMRIWATSARRVTAVPSLGSPSAALNQRNARRANSGCRRR